MTALRGRRLAVYIGLCAVWGSTWLVIKIGLRDLPPLTFAGIRMGLACLLLVPFALTAQWSLSRREAFFVAIAGLLQIGLSYALLFIATQWIASGLAAILFASFPIWVALFAHYLLPDEPLTVRAITAAVLGLAGVVVIEAPAFSGLFSSAGGHVVTASTSTKTDQATYTINTCSNFGAELQGQSSGSTIWINGNLQGWQELQNIPLRVSLCGQTLVGCGFLLLGARILENGVAMRWTSSALAALAYLAIFGTALTFAGLFWLIPKVPVAVIGTIPLVDTLVAVFLGNLVLRETLSLRILAGGAMILVGVVLAVWGRRSTGLAAP